MTHPAIQWFQAACAMVLAAATLATSSSASEQADAAPPAILLVFRSGKQQVEVGAETPLGGRLLTWYRGLPRRRFRLDINTYTPDCVIHFSQGEQVLCHSSGRLVLNTGRGILARPVSATFDPTDPVLVELHAILDQARQLRAEESID